MARELDLSMSLLLSVLASLVVVDWMWWSAFERTRPLLQRRQLEAAL